MNTSYFKNDRPELQALVPSGCRMVLDVGCGEGHFGEQLTRKKGCEVWGIEPVSVAAAEARTRLTKVFTGFFEDTCLHLGQKFDLVCFNDTLEHMANPWECLTLTRELLTERGHILVSLPNILHYYEFLSILKNKDWRYANAGIMDRTHLRWFTMKSARQMLEESGFKVIQIKGLDPTPSKLMTMISVLSFGYYSEMRFPQFAFIAKPR
jgi:2-polyprenyl-3-methyl-5-hydroxy-6-metoxy-1,4-benzoquinol methylase